MELQEKERKERREHEVRLSQMLGNMLKPSFPSTYHSWSPSYNFDYEHQQVFICYIFTVTLSPSPHAYMYMYMHTRIHTFLKPPSSVHTLLYKHPIVHAPPLPPNNIYTLNFQYNKNISQQILLSYYMYVIVLEVIVDMQLSDVHVSFMPYDNMP